MFCSIVIFGKWVFSLNRYFLNGFLGYNYLYKLEFISILFIDDFVCLFIEEILIDVYFVSDIVLGIRI